MESRMQQLGERSLYRRGFIGGSDARIVMGNDEAKLIRLWREKRGDVAPEDLSGNLIVQLGKATENLNRTWYERNTGRTVGDVQRHVKHSLIPWMAVTLDGTVESIGAVFEAKFMLPWSFSDEAAAEKYMAQVQHNMWVTHLKTAVLSIITAAENGWKLPSPWTRSISVSWSRRKRNSGAACSPVTRRIWSMRSRRAHGWRLSALST